MSSRVGQRAGLCDFLFARRERLDLSEGAVAARCGRKLSWYRLIEGGGRRTLKLEELAALEKALELTADSLVRRAREAGF